MDLLTAQGIDDVVVFGGGIIPAADIDELQAMGVGAVFTPGAANSEIVSWVRSHTRPAVAR
jgi:methylmalonyl-CoA mutase C-terminal domain/subunit